MHNTQMAKENLVNTKGPTTWASGAQPKNSTVQQASDRYDGQSLACCALQALAGARRSPPFYTGRKVVLRQGYGINHGAKTKHKLKCWVFVLFWFSL